MISFMFADDTTHYSVSWRLQSTIRLLAAMVCEIGIEFQHLKLINSLWKKWFCGIAIV